MNKRIIDLRVIFNFFYERLGVCINFSMCEKSVSRILYVYGDKTRWLWPLFV